MSGDLRYRLIVDMSSTGSLGPQLDKIGRSGNDLTGAFSKIGGLASSAAGTIANAFTGAVEAAASVAAGIAKIGAVGAVAAVGLGVKLNDELEKTQVSLASIFSAEGVSNGMLSGMKDARDVMKDMRKDAADLPGEFKDLAGIFRAASTPGFQAGGSIKQIEKLSANAMATIAGMDLGGGMQQGARELAMLLQGRAGAHNVFGSLLGFSGDKAQAFNASKPQERLKSVEAELDKRAPSRAFYAQTFDAMSGTFIDNAKKFLGAATGGVFDRVKAALATTNEWFDRNEAKIIGFAEKVGDRLSFAFEAGRRHIEMWGPSVVTFAENAYARISSIWQRIEPMIEKLGGMVAKAFADPATFDKIGSILKLYAAVKVGGMIAPSVSSLGSLGGLMGGGEGLAGAMGGIAGIGAAAGVGAAAIAVLGLGAYGASDILTDASNRFHDGAIASVNEIKENFSKLADAGKAAAPAVRTVADAYGSYLLGGISFWSGMLAEGANDIQRHTGPLAEAFGMLSEAGRKAASMLDPAGAPGGYGGPDVSDPFFSLKKMGGGGEDDDRGRAKTKPVHGGGGTTIQKVEIVVSSNQDPSRIARAVQDRMADLSRNPTSSRHVRNWSANR